MLYTGHLDIYREQNAYLQVHNGRELVMAGSSLALCNELDPPASGVASLEQPNESKFEIVPADERPNQQYCRADTQTHGIAICTGISRITRGSSQDHGCVVAKFEVLRELPAEYAVGVFRPGASS